MTRRATKPDVMTPEQRSRCMSHIKGKDTGPEVVLRKALWHAGLRYRLNYKLPGRPDIVFVGARVAVFVDGCFWHSCPLHGVQPGTNSDFWKEKLAGNVRRDKEVNKKLADLGWTVLRVWEHEVKDNLGVVLNRIILACKGGVKG